MKIETSESDNGLNVLFFSFLFFDDDLNLERHSRLEKECWDINSLELRA